MVLGLEFFTYLCYYFTNDRRLKVGDMPLSEQERRCVDFACRYLEEHYGGSWSIQQYLDDLNLPEPTPEVIVSNGERTAAVEVKRLTGDSTHQEYVASLLSNEKFLLPSCGGSYYLNPAVDFRLPMFADLRRVVKREIERVAPTLDPGQKGAIRILRNGHVSLISESGPSSISCLHGGPYSGLMDQLKEKITGKFMLIDNGWEHSFVTRDCEAAFEAAVVIACKECLEGKTGPFSWYEEWELVRIDNEGDEHAQDGVWIIATTDARSMQESANQCVHAVLNKAMQKFRKRRWADLQIIVLETSGLAPTSLAAHAVETFEPSDRELIDHFLLVDGEDITEASVLVSTMSHAAEADEQRRRQHVIDSPVSEARVQRFKEDYLKGRRDIGATEKIFRHCGTFQHQNERNDSASFGFNRLIHKGPFVDDSNWADLRGWEFAVAEERRLLNDLHTHLAESARQTGQMLSDNIARHPGETLRTATRMSDLLVDRGFRGNLIVVAAHLEVETLVSLKKALTTPSWELTDDLRTNWILGKHAICPVLYLNDQDLNSLFVVDVARFATLAQYNPLVDLHVLPIDEATAKRILEDKPDLKLDMSVLRSMVHLTLYQSYEIQIHDRHAVWATKFSP